jgi:hypothetical protein
VAAIQFHIDADVEGEQFAKAFWWNGNAASLRRVEEFTEKAARACNLDRRSLGYNVLHQLPQTGFLERKAHRQLQMSAIVSYLLLMLEKHDPDRDPVDLIGDRTITVTFSVRDNGITCHINQGQHVLVN